MTKEQIIEEYKKLGELIAYEMSLGEQAIKLSIEQRSAHKATLLQQDKVRNLEL